MVTDAELLRRYADDHSDPAFAELVARHLDLVYSAALRQVGGDAHRARDVAQVVFTTLARKAASLTGHPVLTGWLYTATQHAAAKIVRTEARRSAREKEAHMMQDNLTRDDATIDWDQMRPVLDEAMSELGPPEREAILLRYFARRPFREIGSVLNVNEDAARMRVDRALDKLHRALVRRGVTSTSSAVAVVLSAKAVAAAPTGLVSVVSSAALAGAASAGVAIGSSLAAGAVTSIFMSTGKITAVVVAIGGLAAVGLGVHGLIEARKAAVLVESANAERDTLRARLAAAETRVQQAEARARESEIRLAGVGPAVGAASEPGNAKVTAALPAGDDPALAVMKAKLAQAVVNKQALNDVRFNPDFQRAALEAQSSSLRGRFSPLYANLNLSGEQVARFEKRLVDSFQDEQDFGAALQAKGVAQNDPAVATLAAQERAKLEADLRAIIGDAGLREYQAYERSYGAREVVNTMLGSLVYTGATLSPQQVNQLTGLIAAQSAAYQKGGRVANRGADVNWDGVLAEAPQFLTPPQAALLRGAADQARAQRTMEQIMRAASPAPAAIQKPTKPAPAPGG